MYFLNFCHLHAFTRYKVKCPFSTNFNVISYLVSFCGTTNFYQGKYSIKVLRHRLNGLRRMCYSASQGLQSIDANGCRSPGVKNSLFLMQNMTGCIRNSLLMGFVYDYFSGQIKTWDLMGLSFGSFHCLKSRPITVHTTVYKYELSKAKIIESLLSFELKLSFLSV